VKDQFSSIRYTDLVFDGAVKVRARPALLARRPAPCPLPRAARTSRAHATSSPQAAWVLPLSGETHETGTLARFLGTLGIDVTEVALDDESDAESDADSLIDDEAREVSAAAAAAEGVEAGGEEH